MRKLLNMSHTNVHTIAYLLAGVSMFGYAISFLRDRAFAHYFGPSELLDIYVASFRIPDVLFIAATAFISVYALLPMFEEKQRQGEKDLQEFVNTSFYFLILFLLFGATVLFFAIPFLGDTLFSNFSGESRSIFILFSRVYLIQAALFAVSSFFTAILQLKRKFLLYSLLPILYNIGIIFGVMVLYPLFGATGLALGVLIGVALHTLIQLPVMLQNNILPRLVPTVHAARECWRSIKLSIPRASALLSYSITHIFILSSVAVISEGAVSIFYFAEHIKAVPAYVIGTAYSVATFPILVTYFTENNMRAFRSVVENAFRRLFFFILPAIALLFTLREPIVSLLFETGLFTSETVTATATIVGVFVVGALTISILMLCARALYACGRSVEAFIVFLILSVTEIVLIRTVIPFVQNNTAVLTAIQQSTGLESSTHSVLLVAALIIVIPELFASLVLLGILFRNIQQRLQPVVVAFLQNMLAVLALIAVTMVSKSLFFGETHFNSLEGVIAIVCMSAVGVAAWYAVLCITRNKERMLLEAKVLAALRRVWRI